MDADPLDWRIERACAAAYPPRRVVRAGDWAVALSGGGSRRSNSASALGPDATLDAATRAAIEAVFAAAGQPVIVRVTELTPAVDALLDRAGFAPPEGATRTLLRTLAPAARAHAPLQGAAVAEADVVRAAAPDAPWLATRRRLAPSVEDPARVAGRVAAPSCYARIGDAAIGYAVLHDGIAVIEAIGTDPRARRRGYARATVATLVDWAAGAGATHAALQVEATNAAARALYDHAGFATDRYGYHYRRSMACPRHG